MNSSKQITISKKDAVFWLDKNGRWHNQAGEFKHKKIIDHFHASIRKDKNGYHLFQSHGEHSEKVYFNYEDTALFVFDIISEDADIFLLLNTRQKIKLLPQNLFIKDDQLYIQAEDDRIRFSERALTQISRYIDCEEGQYFLRVSDGKFLIDCDIQSER